MHDGNFEELRMRASYKSTESTQTKMIQSDLGTCPTSRRFSTITITAMGITIKSPYINSRLNLTNTHIISYEGNRLKYIYINPSNNWLIYPHATRKATRPRTRSEIGRNKYTVLMQQAKRYSVCATVKYALTTSLVNLETCSCKYSSTQGHAAQVQKQ
jgi:hypothetical protein